jgi:hypothetical protein
MFGWRCSRKARNKDSSFSEEKEAKRLLPYDVEAPGFPASNGEKFFGSFFQKGTRLEPV